MCFYKEKMKKQVKITDQNSQQNQHLYKGEKRPCYGRFSLRGV